MTDTCDWCGLPAAGHVTLRSGAPADLCARHAEWVIKQNSVSVFSASFDRLEYARLARRVEAKQRRYGKDRGRPNINRREVS